jgi:uncharacterized membrane protein
LREVESIYHGGPEGARVVLATIAGSMIGVTGIVFSITIVTLTLASSQFGPRLLRNFMRDVGNQIVLGTFLATFIYCLLVLRVVKTLDDAQFVPNVSVTCGIVMVLASLGVLIYFMHHTAVEIQADTVIAGVSQELHDALERLYPEKLGHASPVPAEPEYVTTPLGDTALHDDTVMAAQSGYLQAVDHDRLLQLGTTHDAWFRLAYRPGDFVVEGSPLVTVYPGVRVDDTLSAEVHRAFILGGQRTYEQDVRFAFQQLVEIAIRALSPGINDPYTAVACLDRIGAALCQLASRALPAVYRYDDDKRLRLIVSPVTFADITEAVFTPIRQYSRTSLMVTLRLLEIMAIVAPHIRRDEDRQALLRQAVMIAHGSHDGLPEEGDRQLVEARYQTAVQVLNQSIPPGGRV